MKHEVTVTKVDNGYIVKHYDWVGRTEVFRTLDEVLSELLSCFEARSEVFCGDLYGKVTIERGKSDRLKFVGY